jgi:hypothetical protein
MQNDFDLSEKCRMFAFDSDQESFSVIESAAFFMLLCDVSYLKK